MWINKTHLEEARNRVTELLAELKKLESRTYLIDIDRKDRKNRFIFVRNGEVYEIETVSLMQDNLKQWKDVLLR